MQAMRVQHARKGAQYERAHAVLQENAYKNARAHTENEWKGPPPGVGGKEGGKQDINKEGKKKETNKHNQEANNLNKQKEEANNSNKDK